MYQTKHFALHELVPKHVFDYYGDQAWEFLDDRALRSLDELRDAYGTITVNNWRWGGTRQWSGLRTEQSPYGTAFSQHRFGRAFDCIFHRVPVDKVRKEILDDPSRFPLIGSVELGTDWLHFDVRNCPRIKTYYP